MTCAATCFLWREHAGHAVIRSGKIITSANRVGWLPKERQVVPKQLLFEDYARGKLLKGVEIKNKLEKISKSVYGNTLEAIIGAVFIDKGFCVAENLIIEKIYNSNIK